MAVARLIVTDSTADLPSQVVQRLGIHVMPVNVVLDGKTYRDRVDISAEDFYAHYDRYGTMRTEAITYEDYALDYLKFTQAYPEVIILHCSHHLSETYATACRVHADFSDQHNCRVTIIDSGLCSMALGLVAIAAAQVTHRGYDWETTGRVIDDWMTNIQSYMAIPTLKYLKKGKKIGGIRALVGLALGVKPVMAFDQGRLVVRSKLLGEQKNMILTMIDRIRADIGQQPITLAIHHSRETLVAGRIREVFETGFDCRQIFVSYFGPSIGINTGPETTAVMYYKHAS